MENKTFQPDDQTTNDIEKQVDEDAQERSINELAAGLKTSLNRDRRERQATEARHRSRMGSDTSVDK